MNSKWITLKNFIRQNRPIDILPERCFEVYFSWIWIDKQ